MTYKVEEVNAGLCTGTLVNAIEAKINQMASQGWKLNSMKQLLVVAVCSLATKL